MELKGFQRITWTAWIEATSVSKQRANKVLIKPYDCYEHEPHRDTSLSQWLSNDFLNESIGASTASLRAKTTISILPKQCCFILKFSRTVRLITFLCTAFLIFFLAIAKPSLGWSRSFLMANRVKYWSLDFTGLAKTFLYSAGFFNRSCGGKLKTSSATQPSIKRLTGRDLLLCGHW